MTGRRFQSRNQNGQSVALAIATGRDSAREGVYHHAPTPPVEGKGGSSSSQYHLVGSAGSGRNWGPGQPPAGNDSLLLAFAPLNRATPVKVAPPNQASPVKVASSNTATPVKVASSNQASPVKVTP